MPYLDYNISTDDVFPAKNSTRGKICALIKEFVNSGKSIAEIVLSENEYASANSAYTVYKDAINRMKLYDDVKVFTRNKRLFIMREAKEV